MRHFEKSLVIKGSSDPKRYLWQRFKLMFKLSEEQNNAIICKALKWLYNHLEILKIKYIFGYGMGGGGETGLRQPTPLSTIRPHAIEAWIFRNQSNLVPFPLSLF